jgi:hypothetical protein
MKRMMTTKSFIHKLLYTGAIGLSIFVLLVIVTFSWIGYEVKSQCQKAQRDYGKDCVLSLVDLLNDENKEFRSRNSAIWALGQMGDSRALPTLERYYTGDIPEREPLNKSISQYELKKAINLASGGLNITAFFWRGILTD